jgi:dTDP-glucose 4,6-dehydratase
MPVHKLAEKIAELGGMYNRLAFKYEDFHSFRQGHDLHYGLDGAKIAELGWKAPVSLEESLKKTVEWMLDNPEWL